jgi:hypothetical protein
MDTAPVRCPSCQAPVSVPADEDEVTCEQCGTTFIYDPDLEPVTRSEPTKSGRGWNTVVGCFGWGALWMFAVTILLSGTGSSQTGGVIALVLATAAVVGLYAWSRRSKAARGASR